MTSMVQLLGRPVEVDAVAGVIVEQFGQGVVRVGHGEKWDFGLGIRELDSARIDASARASPGRLRVRLPVALLIFFLLILFLLISM